MTATTEIATTATAETRSFQNQKHGFDFDGWCKQKGSSRCSKRDMRSFVLVNYLNSDDQHVSAKQLKQFGLQTGDTVVAGTYELGKNTTRSSMSRA